MILVLFFTRGVSLKTWLDTGLFYREKLIYEEHLKRGNLKEVYWLTYGYKDGELEKTLKKNGGLHPDIKVVPMPRYFSIRKIGSWLYSIIMPFMQRDLMKKADILKTNQIDGSWAAVISKYIYKKPLILRSGFIISNRPKFSQNIKIVSRKNLRFFILVEWLSFKCCNIAVVSSKNDKQYLCKKYNINPDNIHVLYNYIDVDQFYPMNVQKYDNRIVFVGRLSQEKNLSNLIRAITETGLTLDIYGIGELKSELEKLTIEIGGKVNFRGTVPNNEIPIILNKYKYFILPSFYEGMPKTLLEAMACGLVCIGTNVKGINEIIEDSKTGYLAYDTGYLELAEAIKKAYRSDNNYIGLNARRKIVDFYSLKEIVRKERELFFELIT